jgi:hypothetical protein
MGFPKAVMARIRARVRTRRPRQTARVRSALALSFIRTVTVGPGLAPGLLTPAGVVRRPGARGLPCRHGYRRWGIAPRPENAASPEAGPSILEGDRCRCCHAGRAARQRFFFLRGAEAALPVQKSRTWRVASAWIRAPSRLAAALAWPRAAPPTLLAELSQALMKGFLVKKGFRMGGGVARWVGAKDGWNAMMLAPDRKDDVRPTRRLLIATVLQASRPRLSPGTMV